MEAKRKNSSNIYRLQILPGGKREIGRYLLMPEAESDIVCQYGVVVQQTTVAGMELVEFEFLPDAA